MRISMNITTSAEDLDRYDSAEDLKNFYETYGCTGLEVMPMEADTRGIIRSEMVNGVHMRCIGDWMDLDRKFLLEHYREDLAYAREMDAAYVVFHITQVSNEEGLTYRMLHSDAEVIDAAADFINELLDGQDFDRDFLMENLWWPGLTLKDPGLAGRLLERVRYPGKGLMLDTGHFLHTNLELTTQAEAVAYLMEMLDAHAPCLPYIKGIHLQQSLTGAYVKEYLKHPQTPESDPQRLFGQIYEHIFQIDRHQPFTDPGVRQVVARIDPDYLTYEYITESRAQHAEYLEAGSRLFR